MHIKLPKHYKNLNKLETIFDDIVLDEFGVWTQLCKKHIPTHSKYGIYLDDIGSGICGVIGCEEESDNYLQLFDK